MVNIKEFKNSYKAYKRVFAAIHSGTLTFEKVVASYGDKYKSFEDFEAELISTIRKCEASIYMVYNLNGTVSAKEFDKFYRKFSKANKDEKELYEEVNGRKYYELLDYLDKIKKQLEEEDKRRSEEIRVKLETLQKDIENRKKLKQELVEIGIAEDGGAWNVIRVKPERFSDYLEYLESHFDIRI